MDMPTDPAKEMLDRTRRIETRLTKFAIAMGVNVGGDRPVWQDGKIRVPSRACSLKEMMSVVPDDWDQEAEISVYIEDDFVLSFFTSPSTG